MEGKSTDVTNVEEAKATYSDLKITGDGDLFTVLTKASTKNWMKSTKAMQVPGGVVIQVSTQINNIDGTHSVAEAVCYVPNVVIVPDKNNGKRLTFSSES